MGICISLARRSPFSRNKRPNNHTQKCNLKNPNRNKLRSSFNVLKNPYQNDISERYELGKEMGRGEFGVTYRCRDRETGESAACKKISKSKLKTYVDMEDVRREVEIMKRLPKHPNIVAYKDAYEDKDAIYLIMELCQGGELFDRIVKRGHYSERAAAAAIKTMLEVVKVCHEHGVMHRDLKPENFLYADNTETAPLKAIDFGLSIFFKPGQRFNELVGSPYYMAPEVLRRNYGPECDVWSIGVILYILLCGVPPFWAEAEEGIARAIVRGRIDFRRDPWPKISEDAKNLIRGMLQQNPSQRLTVDQVLASEWIQLADSAPDISLGEGVQARIKQFSLMNKFKKKVLGIVAGNLPDEQVKGIKQMFLMMDTDKNGNLDFQELKDGLRMLGQSVPDHDVQLLFEAVDMDGNGRLDCEEFMTLAVHMKKIMVGSEELLRQAFLHFDKNNNGYIEFDELQECLEGDHLDANYHQVLHDIIGDADLDKDGRISYPEFKAMMTTGTDWKMSSRQYSREMLSALSFKLFKDSTRPSVDAK
ncbi:calcium-dependent protein kinase 24-like [Andrographis paniculata]|uniref:calcium-dependent protein kinase 24-like n=1 Tax=Andrographis paniculata TaxID=175694 RepID=UPI0021E72E9C|nr:calcium-dependent protein kinase 24-like [Andrographis paniculata]